jgi:predicted ArsR family transcriptional regulator
MQDTKQRILTLLKMNGGLTTSELSEMLDISATAVRRHLNNLEVQDMVAHRTEQRGMGRPSFIYELTDGASSIFPQSYAAFAVSLLEDLVALDGPDKLDELFDKRQERRRQQYISGTTGETLSDRVASLARLLESEGRMTTWEQLDDDRYILREHNCPIRRVADKFDHPCQCEISLLRETLQARVTRVNHIPDGDIACVYEINGASHHAASSQKSNTTETEQQTVAAA